MRATPPMTTPMITPRWLLDELEVALSADEPLPVVLVPDADPDAEFNRMLAGRVLAGAVGCVPSWPLPTMTYVPLLGIPCTFTNINAGPGWKRFAFGGSCAT